MSRSDDFRRALASVTFSLTVVALIVSLPNFFTGRTYWQEINSAFSVYYLAIHLLSLAFLVLVRPGRSLLLRLALIAGHLSMATRYTMPLVPFYTTLTMPPPIVSRSNLREVRLLLVNVYTPNTRYEDLRRMITSTNPDLIGLLEVNDRWLSELALTQSYPFSTVLPRNDNFGIAIYSRIPFSRETETELGDFVPPTLWAHLALPAPGEASAGFVRAGKPGSCELQLVLCHAYPPLADRPFRENRSMFRRIATRVRHNDANVIVAGDFNATPFSAFYGLLRQGAELANASEGRGLFRTWNARSSLLRLAIDHVMYRGMMEVKNFQVLEPFGSDHLPLLVDFTLCPAV